MMKLALALAISSFTVAAWASPQAAVDPATVARVRKVQAETQRQDAEVGQLHRRVDGLETSTAQANQALAEKDRTIAELQRQLQAARNPAAATTAAAARSGH
jgi:hypothetical protein